MRATERQKAAPLAFEEAQSSYSEDSKNRRSAAAIAKNRGSRKSSGVPDIVQPSLHFRNVINQKPLNIEKKVFGEHHKYEQSPVACLISMTVSSETGRGGGAVQPGW